MPIRHRVMKQVPDGTVPAVDLDEVAEELYEVHPDEIVALPKPSTAAWVANVLVREHRQEIEGLVELGGLLRDAQENLAGDQLKALNAQRSQLLGALTRQALAVARQHGHPVSTSIEAQIEDTLRAAMSDPEAGEALLSGRLTSAMSYSGLGTVGGRPDLRLVTTRPSQRAPAASRTGTRAPRRAPADRRTERDRRLAEERRGGGGG